MKSKEEERKAALLFRKIFYFLLLHRLLLVIGRIRRPMKREKRRSIHWETAMRGHKLYTAHTKKKQFWDEMRKKINFKRNKMKILSRLLSRVTVWPAIQKNNKDLSLSLFRVSVEIGDHSPLIRTFNGKVFLKKNKKTKYFFFCIEKLLISCHLVVRTLSGQCQRVTRCPTVGRSLRQMAFDIHARLHSILRTLRDISLKIMTLMESAVYISPLE